MEHSLDALLARITEYCAVHGIAETTFGARAVNDGKLVSRLRAGRTVTLRTLAAIEAELNAAQKNREGAT